MQYDTESVAQISDKTIEYLAWDDWQIATKTKQTKIV
jgi:hypothetical protein